MLNEEKMGTKINGNFLGLFGSASNITQMYLHEWKENGSIDGINYTLLKATNLKHCMYFEYWY